MKPKIGYQLFQNPIQKLLQKHYDAYVTNGSLFPVFAAMPAK